MGFFVGPVTRLLLAGLLLCSSCAVAPSPEERRQDVFRLIQNRSWTDLEITAPPFVLVAFLPQDLFQGQGAGQTLTVYLEGDGLAWLTPSRPSPDPTPVVPMALLLALAQDDGPVAALARPCQYTMPSSAAGTCESRYWTSHRFAPEVITATDRALSRLKILSGASALRLVGYSGGGAVATLVAAGRDDVEELITVAGNLDHAAWTKMHRLNPLSGSLNPLEVAPALARLPQRHFVGTKDRIIPPGIAQAFLARQQGEFCAALLLVEGLGHARGWPQRWPELLRTPGPC